VIQRGLQHIAQGVGAGCHRHSQRQQQGKYGGLKFRTDTAQTRRHGGMEWIHGNEDARIRQKM
jgi:hypothetical protein